MFVAKTVSSLKRHGWLCKLSSLYISKNLGFYRHYANRQINILHSGAVINFFPRNFNSRCSKLMSNIDSDSEEGTNDFASLSEATYKSCLFPDSENKELDRIIEAETAQDMLKTVKAITPLDIEIASQTIVSLHQVLKKFYQYESELWCENIQHLQFSSVFKACLKVLESEFKILSDDILLSVFFGLCHLIPAEDPLTAHFLFRCQEQLPCLSLKNLAKFTAILKKLGVNHHLLIAPIIGMVSPVIQDCNTEKDLLYISTCLKNGLAYVSTDSLTLFFEIVENFIFSGQDMELVTALNCFSVIQLSDDKPRYAELQQLLLSFILNFVPEMKTSDLKFLLKCLSYCICNTDSILTAIEERVLLLLQKSKHHSEILLLLSCSRLSTSSFRFKSAIADWIKNHPEITSDKSAFGVSLLINTLFNIYPINFEELHSNLFNQVALVDMPVMSLHRIVKEHLYLRKISGRNVKAATTLPGFWKFCLEQANNSVKCHDIAIFSCFIISEINSSAPLKLFHRLDEIVPELSMHMLSLLILSFSLGFNKTHSLSKPLQDTMTNLYSKLVELSNKMISSATSLKDYNIYFANLSNLSKCTPAPSVCKQVAINDNFLEGYNRYLDADNLVVHNIAKTSKSITIQRYCLPRVLDAIANCIVERPATQSVRIIANVLQACFTVNYCPQRTEFLQMCQDIVSSQFHRLDCNDLLKSALSLGLFRALNEQIIHEIFSLDFLDRLEKLFSVSSYSHAEHLRMSLAQFNKVVCLDCPEENFPWFHEKFCQAIFSGVNPNLSTFEKEVYDVLCEILPGRNFIKAKVFTPYYYNISFECLLDEFNSPVENCSSRSDLEKDHNNSIRRVAIDVLPEGLYCSNMPRLQGMPTLKMRHLEILGYKLVQVPYFEWYSLQLSKRQSRVDYLYTKIYQ